MKKFLLVSTKFAATLPIRYFCKNRIYLAYREALNRLRGKIYVYEYEKYNKILPRRHRDKFQEFQEFQELRSAQKIIVKI